MISSALLLKLSGCPLFRLEERLCPRAHFLSIRIRRVVRTWNLRKIPKQPPPPGFC